MLYFNGAIQVIASSLQHIFINWIQGKLVSIDTISYLLNQPFSPFIYIIATNFEKDIYFILLDILKYNLEPKYNIITVNILNNVCIYSYLERQWGYSQIRREGNYIIDSKSAKDVKKSKKEVEKRSEEVMNSKEEVTKSKEELKGIV